MPERKSSRDPADLHPELARRWESARAEFTEKYSDLPEVFLTCTYRSRVDQAKSYAQGRTDPGKIVTNARPGQSLHNYYPALAFDIAFKRGKETFWDLPLFEKFAALAKPLGLEWGGDWQRFKDNPHFQPPNFDWRMAAAGKKPVFSGEVPPETPALPSPEPPGPSSQAAITRILRFGCKGPEVQRLQERLALLGFAPGDLDGKFGQDTQAAVEDFQESEGLQVDGVAGPQTLNALGIELVQEEPPPGLLRAGSRGPDVVRLQKRLQELNFDPGPVDGIFGSNTEDAVCEFQEKAGLDVDGIVGPETLKALMKGVPAGEPEAPAPPSQPAPPAAFPPGLEDFTIDLVAGMFPAATPRRNIERYLPYVLTALAGERLADPEMVLMALATIRAESEGFEPINEYKSKWNTTLGGPHDYDKYDYREDLGNQGPPDGARFKGRGFIQLTGRDNYTRVGQAIGLGDRLVKNPELANDPDIAARLLARFIKDKERKIRHALAANNLAAARRLVNGGSHGLQQFTEAFTIGKALLA